MVPARRFNPSAWGLLAGPVALILIAISVGLFLLACVLALVVWLVVVMDQRDHAQAEAADGWFAVAARDSRVRALEEEAMRLHLLLTEAERRAGGAVMVPLLKPGQLRAVPDVPVADLDDVWLELLTTRPGPFEDPAS